MNKTKFNIEFQKKYETCPTYIQTSPNFMNYMKLFNHYYIILNFFTDFKKFMNELDEIKKKDKLIDVKRDKSAQVNRNGVDNKSKNRERSRYKELEKEKEKNKNK